MSSQWSNNAISTKYGSSYYDHGILDDFDHRLEVEQLDKLIGGRRELVCLDLAAGNGRFTQAVFDRAARVTAVDLEEKHVSHLAARFPAGKVQAVLANAVAFLEDTTDQYDLIMTSGLLLFFDDATTTRLLENMKRRLKPGGLLFVRDFISHQGTVALPSGVFAGVTLYYRPMPFYAAFGLEGFEVCRPLHHFPKFEAAVFRRLGFSIYRALWSRPMRTLSWTRIAYANRIMVLKKTGA